MDWLKENNYHQIELNIENKDALIKSVDVIAWATNKFGLPCCDSKSKNSVWDIDAVNGFFIFKFKNLKDYMLFTLTCY